MVAQFLFLSQAYKRWEELIKGTFPAGLKCAAGTIQYLTPTSSSYGLTNTLNMFCEGRFKRFLFFESTPLIFHRSPVIVSHNELLKKGSNTNAAVAAVSSLLLNAFFLLVKTW